MHAFKLPNIIRLDNNAIVFGEEMLLLSLERLHYPGNLVTLQLKYRSSYSTCSRAFKWFIHFMQENWGYLLRDNLMFWKPSIPMFCEKIRQKLSYNCGQEVVSVDQDPHAEFKIFSFIDNTYICYL
jgi:hypothetical protein